MSAACAKGRLAENIAHFARALRAAGLRVGTASTLAAIEAAGAAGIARRDDFREALRATLVSRHEDFAVFDEVFDRFWRPRNLTEKMIAMFSPKAPPRDQEEKRKPGATRAREALAKTPEHARSERGEKAEIEARLLGTREDVARTKDFAQMSAAELASARRAVAALALPLDRVATRRFEPARKGVFDARRSIARAARTGGDLMLPALRRRREIEPPLVILADISGSMSRYSELFLHFAHALSERRRRVHTFLFGTRLTNVTRQLRHRDVDEAMLGCAASVTDWSGGTRIGAALSRFNRDWSRRVLGQGAVVLLVTDGLEVGDTSELATAAERLHKSCRRLIWLCPLLGFEGFAPKARGVRTLLSHVDEFRPVHSIEAIGALCDALSGRAAPAQAPRRWLLADAA